MDKDGLRIFITTRLLSRISPPGGRRDTALRDVLGLVAPHLDDAALERAAQKAPELPPALYEKWTGLFADKLLQSLPDEQLRILCDNSEDNNAALLLAYSMFMESERMERVVANDLRELAGQAPAKEQLLSEMALAAMNAKN